MEIRLKYEIIGGRALYIPVCELSHIIAEVNDKRTFSLAMIERAQLLDIVVKIENMPKNK